MPIIVVANEKGGVGKTTIAVNLAAMCVLAGKDTLLVDSDAQRSANTWTAARYAASVEPPVVCVEKSGKIGRDLLELKAKYGHIVVDSGGRDAVEMRQAIAVADVLLVPIRPAQFDVWSLSRMVDLIKEVEERIERKVNTYTFVNGASTNPSVRETHEVREALKEFGDTFNILESVVSERIAFRKAARQGQSAVELPLGLADTKANIEIINLYQELLHEKFATQTPQHSATVTPIGKAIANG